MQVVTLTLSHPNLQTLTQSPSLLLEQPTHLGRHCSQPAAGKKQLGQLCLSKMLTDFIVKGPLALGLKTRHFIPTRFV